MGGKGSNVDSIVFSLFIHYCSNNQICFARNCFVRDKSYIFPSNSWLRLLAAFAINRLQGMPRSLSSPKHLHSPHRATEESVAKVSQRTAMARSYWETMAGQKRRRWPYARMFIVKGHRCHRGGVGYHCWIVNRHRKKQFSRIL